MRARSSVKKTSPRKCFQSAFWLISGVGSFRRQFRYAGFSQLYLWLFSPIPRVYFIWKIFLFSVINIFGSRQIDMIAQFFFFQGRHLRTKIVSTLSSFHDVKIYLFYRRFICCNSTLLRNEIKLPEKKKTWKYSAETWHTYFKIPPRESQIFYL